MGLLDIDYSLLMLRSVMEGPSPSLNLEDLGTVVEVGSRDFADNAFLLLYLFLLDRTVRVVPPVEVELPGTV